MNTKMTSTSSDGLIQFEFDEDLLKVVEDALGDLKSEARKVLKNAVNKTAKQAKADLATKAQETYVVKKTRFTKAMTTKNATVSNPEATINITGEQLELKDFKVSPATYKTGDARPSVTKAKVLLSSSLKPLAAENKAFIAKFKNGHASVVQRKTRERFPLKKLLSNSIPKMVGNQDKVYGVVKPEIYDNLMANIEVEIGKVLKSA
jgi:hypothetical protein